MTRRRPAPCTRGARRRDRSRTPAAPRDPSATSALAAIERRRDPGARQKCAGNGASTTRSGDTSSAIDAATATTARGSAVNGSPTAPDPIRFAGAADRNSARPPRGAFARRPDRAVRRPVAFRQPADRDLGRPGGRRRRRDRAIGRLGGDQMALGPGHPPPGRGSIGAERGAPGPPRGVRSAARGSPDPARAGFDRRLRGRRAADRTPRAARHRGRGVDRQGSVSRSCGRGAVRHRAGRGRALFRSSAPTSRIALGAVRLVLPRRPAPGPAAPGFCRARRRARAGRRPTAPDGSTP